jgi:hypothetical protein
LLSAAVFALDIVFLTPPLPPSLKRSGKRVN